jgi:hypothetical protein
MWERNVLISNYINSDFHTNDHREILSDLVSASVSVSPERAIVISHQTGDWSEQKMEIGNFRIQGNAILSHRDLNKQ